MALLHKMNDVRVPYFAKFLAQGDILDIGCGGGFVSEALALQTYNVTGMDLSESSLAQARAHASSYSPPQPSILTR